MSIKTNQTGSGGSGRRPRFRFRDGLTGRTGKTIGFASLAAPIIGYVVNDLRKPESIVRSLVSGAVRKFLPVKTDKVETIDITNEVEIMENKSDAKN